MEKSGSAIVQFSGWFLRKRVSNASLAARLATGRPVTAMLPCEMGRYIAGFSGEARRYGAVLGLNGRLNLRIRLSERRARNIYPMIDAIAQ